MKRLLAVLGLVLLLLPTTFFGLLWAKQDRLIFPGPRADEAEVRARAELAGARLFGVETADGETLLAWHEARGGRAAVLYFHGNGSICDPGDAYRAILDSEGVDFLCVAYRGYPGSSGQPSERGLRADARALWAQALSLGFAPEHLLLHGRSLGGGVAIGLAAEVDAAGLLVESSFRSVRLLAAEDYPTLAVDLLLAHPFDSEALVPAIDEPALVVHGDADGTIPVAHGRWLGAHLPRATYVEAPGHGHNSALLTTDPAARAALVDFLDRALPH